MPGESQPASLGDIIDRWQIRCPQRVAIQLGRQATSQEVYISNTADEAHAVRAAIRRHTQVDRYLLVAIVLAIALVLVPLWLIGGLCIGRSISIRRPRPHAHALGMPHPSERSVHVEEMPGWIVPGCLGDCRCCDDHSSAAPILEWISPLPLDSTINCCL